MERAVGGLRLLCATFLYKSYPRLTRPPVSLETDELLGGVVAGLLMALRTTRPPTVLRFFALANQQMRRQLNDPARRLDERPAAAAAVGPLTREKASPTFAPLPKGHDRQTESGAPPDRAGRTGYARYQGITGDHGQ